ncbi:MAG TPA: protein-disulfide reductase DsbD [Steroidobacteraceae bacterium]|jgi:thiol:disulfide interchange protein DsbD
MRSLGIALGLLALAVSGFIPAARAAQGADIGALVSQSRAAKSGDDFLPPEQAFRFTATADSPSQIRLIWAIAPGYYLYRDRIQASSELADAKLGAPQFPDGQVKNDEYFGKQVVYHNELVVPLPVQRATDGTLTVPLKITYQGCAEAGLCYPPVTRQVSVQLPPAAGSGTSGQAATGTPTGAAGTPAAAATYVSEQDRLAELLRTGSLFSVLLQFFIGGLLLAFTPCVLPMVPILSGLIVGQGSSVNTSRAFLLSLTYVLGMAVTYTLTGALFAAAGKQVQAVFQQPWIIVLFAALFVAMSLSMFGLYTVQMPGFIQTRIAQLSNRQQGGSFGGVAVMGMLSALIVTTCVGPVLVAALLVIGQTGDVLRGAAALFAMSLGMGAPLLLVGSSAGRWMPRAGAWMDSVKRLFGALMLALAAWMLTRIVPARWTLALFVLPAAAAAIVLWKFVPKTPVRRAFRDRDDATGTQRAPVAGAALWSARAVALLCGLYAAALLVGAGRGAEDPLRPLTPSSVLSAEPEFTSVSSVADLQREVQAAAAAHQSVMLDFYADWCTSCKEMQRYTFTDPAVRAALKSVRLLRADVTANNADDQALLHQFQIYGPPTIAFYDAQGREQQAYRVVGYMKAPQFAALLHQALAGSG